MKLERKVIYVDGVAGRILARRWSFLVVFLLVFFVSYTSLSSIGIAPGMLRAPALSNGSDTVPEAPADGGYLHVPSGEGELPMRIEIPSIGIRASVSNPESTSVSVLDAALLTGTVRYPGSGTPGEAGNVLIFGHSSHLPIVHNQAFKAFNDIQNLKKGEPIILYGEGKVYVYAVEKVEEANASTDAIPLAVDGAKLTLATCDNFGEKQDRFIVTATLVKVDTAE